MLTAVKNQFKISYLSVKYALMKEMLNKATFLSNIIFMIFNNAIFIVQWIIFFSLKENLGGYQFKQILLLWGFAASTYGLSHFIFEGSHKLSETINNGKLDAYLVQPKNVLLSAITTEVSPSALGDIIYGFIMLFLYGFTISRFFLFIIFSTCGGLIITSTSIILNSLSFWFKKTDTVADIHHGLMISFATYPDGIFKGITKVLLYTLIPVGIANYIPIKVIINFSLPLTLIVILVTLLLIITSFIVFFKGLKRYSSSNLMIARI